MKIKKTNRISRQITVFCLIIVLALVAGSLLYVYAFKGNLFGWEVTKNSADNSSINYSTATKEEQQAGAQAKAGSNNDTPPTPKTVTGSTKKNVQIAITAANLNGSTLQVRTLISAVADAGTCTLELTREGHQTITETAGSQALASTSTCQGFNIPVSGLAVGTWHILVEYSSSTLAGSTSQDVVIK